MKLRLLGTVEVVNLAGEAVPIGGPKERAVLALLAIHANETVSEDRLVDALWGENPPRTATKTIQAYVSRLRRALVPPDGDAGLVIQTRSPGYRLEVAPGALDVTEAEELIAQGQAAAAEGDHGWAAVTLARAWRLWRGRSLGEFADDSFAAAAATRLEELRQVALEERIEAELLTGRHAPLVGELEGLCAAHPMRERLWTQRMVALYRSGRQAEALRVFQDLYRHLGEELGIEPGPEAVAVEQAIINHAPSLDWKPRETNAVAASGLPTGVVTFLLTDIVDSTALWDAHPGPMADALECHDQLVADVVAGHGGHLIKAKGEGDATLSAFRRASDAVAAAVALRVSIEAEAWPDPIAMHVRLALHTGEANERGGDFYGPTVNRAARLRSVATGGQVIVSEATAALVRDHLPHGVVLADLGRHELRGLARDEQVYELSTADVGAAVPPQLASPLAVPLPSALAPTRTIRFVGRDVEFTRLGELWEEAKTGSRRVALIAGEPGVGKTRLASEIARNAHADGAVVLFGRCDEDLGVPYQPFAEALAHFASHLGGGDGWSLGPLAGELARLVPDLRQRLRGLADPLQTDGETERQRLFDALAGWLGATAQRTPIVLVLDDLHWATKPTLLLLRHLLREPEAAGVLIVGTYRDTELDRAHPLADTLADLRREAVVERVVLRGLDESGAVAFVEASAGRALEPGEDALAQALRAETNGNPFFMSEVMRHLADTGAVTRTDGGWVSTVRNIEDAGLPEGVREVISRRVSRLSDHANKALAVASVIGPVFERQVLERVPDAGDDPDALLDALDEAVRAGLIVESGPKHAFAHALIRHTLYHELTTARRTRLHRRVGEAIESLPDADRRVEALAYHFAEAALDGQHEKAADYALAAGQRALAHLAHEEAIAQLERGLAVLDLQEHGDAARRCDLLYSVATTKKALGDRAGARDAIVGVGDIAKELRDAERLSRAAVLMASLGEFAQPDAGVPPTCEAALALLPEDEVALRARVLAALARYLSNCEFETERAQPLAIEAIELARSVGDAGILLACLGARLACAPPAEERQLLADEIVELAKGIGDTLAQADALRHHGVAALARGDRAASDADLAALQELGERHRWWWPLAVAAVARAGCKVMEGRFAEAEDDLAEATTLAPTSIDVAIMALAVQVLSPYLQSDADRFVPLFMAVLQMSPLLRARFPVDDEELLRHIHTEEPDWAVRILAMLNETARVPSPLLPLALIVRSQCAGVLKDARGVARVVYEEHLPQRGYMVELVQAPVMVGAADRGLGIASWVMGDWDQSEEYFEAGLALEEGLGFAALSAETRVWFARMLVERGRPGDSERARELATVASDDAVRLGLKWVEAASASLLGSLR